MTSEQVKAQAQEAGDDARSRKDGAAPPRPADRPSSNPPKTPRRPAVEEVADVAGRLAVLLSAGVPPAAAWEYLAEPTPQRSADAVTERVIRTAARAARRGGDVPSAIASAADGLTRIRRGARRAATTEVRQAWRGLAAAIQVATGSGAPLAEALRQLAGALRDLGQAERDRSTALAGPRATARTVLALPVVGILFGAGLGFDTLHVLFGTPAGLGCLAVGAALMLAARAWNGSLLRRASSARPLAGLSVDLIAMAMAGGGSIVGARARVADACARFGLEPPLEETIAPVLSLAERAGVGTADLLSAEAEQQRRDARAIAQAASAALAVRLMAPLAVCVLPAFMVLSVVPLVMSILSSTIRGI